MVFIVTTLIYVNNTERLLEILKLINSSRKSQPWWRFGYVILLSIKFGKLLLWFCPRFVNGLKSCIKHSKERFIRFPNTSKLVKRTRLRLVFSTTSQCLEIWWNTLTRVWYFSSKVLKLSLKFYKDYISYSKITNNSLQFFIERLSVNVQSAAESEII